ncbi:MAG: nucleotide exchange factor GrpE [Anabaena sp. CoA2_C59]|jgi:molecular chaperone GrpE|uniref:Protein GrpE n=2 Tax=Aphanizomenon flos-aquae TaxID=1176 RepID=A0A1B7X3R5_APHFL|nr:nucleotide exchange factor GrpE [Aphanizomenon flos-aquae Clear-A1]MBO1043343.1 nucleotide exchange factor GrpE [Aphanizomenon flos-aquae UKL13-PB]MBO1059029.1 nucleotide exchange factor GrpE [Dolichospermum sp. JUN01]MBO1060654.1 nucleotide exchange factor GrpE [Aphanizomenon flos-aquae CP01]MCE2905395.1 nucleotide exchange factor GrpE [Anabaena sp. CoA2_C59]MDJ0506213.1 nucleotide exchange factor GrpE [Nostocales cyanobacterium LE14-WE12]NTW19024.1 nucleotide exchange factor GrpE [Nostoc
MKSDSASEINSNQSGSEINDQAANQINEQEENILTEEYGDATANPIQLDVAVLSDLTQQIETLKIQLEERSSQYMRIAADFENYRKRTAKEKEELDLQVKRNTITELLPVVDNFERARAHLKPQSEGEITIHKSYQGVYKQLVDCLKRLGVAPMRPEGQEFDPNLHEAVMREPTDEYPEGTVLEELVRGYYFGERVLRHALVKVAAPREDLSSVPEDSSGEDNS